MSIKTSIYVDLKKELEKEGYSMIMKAVEMEARGFIAGTIYQPLRSGRIWHKVNF